ncbi:hypothetical protein Slin15195_G129910 [Septoria linicola]|uniref:Uncharacterized protein n=1 Tax=Septoria linicola TaxID=215465 RepID=A0A9Q9ER96_9PEZI|nr:hypothetical protein Slin15195_G129910 [Septoria linicola]
MDTATLPTTSALPPADTAEQLEGDSGFHTAPNGPKSNENTADGYNKDRFENDSSATGLPSDLNQDDQEASENNTCDEHTMSQQLVKLQKQIGELQKGFTYLDD